ncbi:MAG: bifunctional folylpolyglutamate synthase/dihydrofolate synthase [Proteobacteria bacterium]|uniref:Dihydrofolate synthase/folylpolyglutamate synthase n=1 Tax=Candidatus Avisuccinivibrio stercorigallinarum TaxID=2840704 RepID=A0A9D9DCM1_9GAMM|nr:bifunctional folylpolyglutamate synthase/dihydrofolate synthase [Candidatus Avisuccinivibrio stercorigallinarum]
MSNLNQGELGDWLSYLENINPNRIELGLDRVRAVLKRLNLDFSRTKVIEVAGTNGKGSSGALIDAALRAAGLKSCLYTSPHLHRFNERVVINGRQASDEELAEAFAAVYARREGVELTYFEYTTLAAFYLFAKAQPDVLVLEIGLGGRLDAVNVLDADIALIASIGLDHVRILGHTIEEIAHEKAGIIKPHCKVVTGLLDPAARAVVKAEAKKQQAQIYCEGEDFSACSTDGTVFAEGQTGPFDLKMGETVIFSALPYPKIPMICAPSALMVIYLLRRAGLNIPDAAVTKALTSAALPGRMQLVSTRPDLYLDVAHNVPAAKHLVQVLKSRPLKGRRLAVIGMLRDKDIEGVLKLISPLFDAFYTATLHTERGEQAARLNQALSVCAPEALLKSYNKVDEALAGALAAAAPDDEIVVLGSFVTVSEADAFLKGTTGLEV